MVKTPLLEIGFFLFGNYFRKMAKLGDNKGKNIYILFHPNLIFIFFVFGIADFKSVTKDICELPSFLSTALFRKIDVIGTGIVTR